MSGFQERVDADNRGVFLNLDEFAALRTVIYDGVVYEDIPVVLAKTREKERRRLVTTDHTQGIFMVYAVAHCAAADLGGQLPEKGQRIKINDREGGGGFFREFYIASAGCEMGMLRLALEALDE